MSTKRGTTAIRRSGRSTRKRTAKKRSERETWSIARDDKRTVKQRSAALADLSRGLCDDHAKFQSVLDMLQNKDAPSELRLAALRTLQAASFSVVKFNPCRSEYLGALRSVADDRDRELRQRVLGILAREQDGYAQQRLLEGLKDRKKALVSPEKALQLLSYDVHGEAYPVAREIVSKPPNAAARREALRLLAADASSAPVFEQLLRDKKEKPEIRRLSASALSSLDPQKLQTHAREIVLDPTEKGAIKATSLAALTEFGDETTVGKDEDLQQRVNRLKTGASSPKVKQGARRFLSKYSR